MSTARIQNYYMTTYWDYRLVWTGRDTLACHFGYYDETVRNHGAALLRNNEKLADLADVDSGSRVFDAGCGIGGTALWLAEQRGASVVGVSLSERQVRRARRAAAERAVVGKVSFFVGDYGTVALPAGSVDAVIALESLCHSPDKQAFFAEAHRILRPGGRLVVSDYLRVRPDADARETEIMHGWRDGWAIADLASVDDLTDMAAVAGFRDIQRADVTNHVKRSLRRLYRLTYLGIPISHVLVAIGLRDKQAHGNVVASRLQYLSLRRGLWRYIHFAATK